MYSLGKTIKLVLGIIFSVFFCWLFIRQVHYAEIKNAFVGVSFSWIVLACCALAIDYMLRIERWRLMLGESVSWKQCSGPFLSSFAVNNIFPLRAGDVMRIFAFNHQLKSNASIIMATLFVERVLDLFLLIVVLALVLLSVDVDFKQITGVGGLLLFFVAAILLLVLIFPKMFQPLVNTFIGLIAIFSSSLQIKLRQVSDTAFETIISLSRKHILIRLLFLTALAWSFEGLVFFCVALSIPTITEVFAIWLAFPVGTLATLIPSSPGYIGTFDFFTERAMSLLGNEKSAAVVYALLTHIILWLPITSVGGLYLLLHPVRHLKNKEN